MWSEREVTVLGREVRFSILGEGRPLIVLHRDFGSRTAAALSQLLAAQMTVLKLTIPGYDGSDRFDWVRSVDEMAVILREFLRTVTIEKCSVLGLGFGAWLAAELAVVSREHIVDMCLVSPFGLKPRHGEILDEFVFSSEEYVRKCFNDEVAYETEFGETLSEDQWVEWEANREMTTRIAWRPRFFCHSLPYLLPALDLPVLVIHGMSDAIVPVDCARRYCELLPNARLELVSGGGHLLEVESPRMVAEGYLRFAGASAHN